jgi:dihydrofolate synthase/folylpolyglutamate synthase
VLTQFEAQLAAAFLLFSETRADLALIETGMGGRDDATNVISRPAAALITPIALDHQDALGASLAEIAAHKAGILKAGAPAIIARQVDDARAVIDARAEAIGAPLFRQGAEWDAFASNGRLVVQTEMRALDLPLPTLVGAHQIDNAGLAVAALLYAGITEFSDATFAAGIAAARWPGRLQPITRGPLAEQARAAGAELWLDGGHNAHAAEALSRALSDLSRKRPARTALIVGLRARKDWRAFLDALAPSAQHLIALPLSEESADPAAIVAHARTLGVASETAPDIPDALTRALAQGATRVLICGSLLLAAKALAERTAQYD